MTRKPRRRQPPNPPEQTAWEQLRDWERFAASAGKKAGRPAPKLPDVGVILQRFMDVTRDPNLAADHMQDPTLQTGYDVGGDSLSTAEIFYSFGARHRAIASTPIGRYQTVGKKWLLYPEYVSPAERQLLIPYFAELQKKRRQERLALVAQGLASLVDVNDPVTRNARSRLGQQLYPLHPAELVGRGAVRDALAEATVTPSAVIGADAFTTWYPILGTTLQALQIKERVGRGETITHDFGGRVVASIAANAFAISYHGLRVVNWDNPEGTLRDSRALVVATRSMEEPDVWLPNVSVITMDEWENVLQPVPAMLEKYHSDDPRFSVMHCGVTYNSPSVHVAPLPE